MLTQYSTPSHPLHKTTLTTKPGIKTNLGSNRLLLETSFTSLNSPQTQEWPQTFYTEKTIKNGGVNYINNTEVTKLAPLASPETLSLNSESTLREIFLETPKKGLRRTPIIRGNLSKCADDEINVLNYAKYIMEDNFKSSIPSNYESAFSLDKDNCCAKLDSNMSFESAKSSLERLLVNKNAFLRNDSLPLLNDLVDKSDCQKVLAKKRPHTVYPMHRVGDNLDVLNISLSSESSV